MRNKLTFPNGGTETKYVWDRYALQNNGIYVWDTHNVIQDDVYYWDKYAIAGKSSYTWDKYDVVSTSHYSWNKYAVRETTDYVWNYWKCAWKEVYFIFTDTTYELEAQTDYTFTNGYLHFYTGPDEKKTYSVASIINNNASLRGILANRIYGFRYSTSSVINYAQPDYLTNSVWSELYVENGAVKITSVQKIKTGALRKFSPTKPANLNYDYVKAPFVSYPSEIIDTYTALTNNAYPVNAYDADKNYFYEAQNDGFWNTSTTGIVADKSQILESYTSTNKNAYTAGLYSTYLLEYAGETVEYSKGTTHSGTVTSSDGGAYPKDGKQGDYWYVMQLTGTHIWNTYSTAPMQTWDVYSLIKSNKLISATSSRRRLAKDGITFYAIITAGTDLYPDTLTGSLSYQSGHTIEVDDPSEDYTADMRTVNDVINNGGGEFQTPSQTDTTYRGMIRALALGEIDSFKVRDTSNILLYSVEDRYYYIVTNDTEIRYNQTTQKFTINNLVKIIDNVKVNNNLHNCWHPTVSYDSGLYWEFADGGDGDIKDFYIGKQDETPRLVRRQDSREIGYLYPIYIPMARDIAVPYYENPDEDVVINSSLEDYEVLKEAIKICRLNESHNTTYWDIFYTNDYYYIGLGNMVFESSKGTTITGSVSSTDKNAYPTDGEQNGYWYVHSGIIPDATTFIGTVESRDKDAYPLNDAVDGVYYVYSHLIDDTIIKGDFIEAVSSSNSNAFPQNSVSGDYWYVYSHMITNYFCGDKNGTVNAETKQAYPANDKIGDVWYVYSHFENNGPYKSRWIDEIEANVRRTYPTDGIQGNYWYVYKKSYTGYKLQINDWQIKGGVNYKHNINPEKDFTIGCVASAEIDFNYDNTADDFQQYLDADYCDYWTWQPNDETWRLIGRFWLTDAEYNRNLVKVQAFDAILATDAYVDEFIANTTYPISVTNFFNNLCRLLGVTGKINSRLANRTFAFQDNFEAINITARQLLQYIAEATGGFIKVEPDGTLYLTTYSSSGKTLDNSNYTSYAKQRYTVEPISGLTVKMNSDDLGVSSGDVENNPYIIENNPLFYTQSDNEIAGAVSNLYHSINNKVYRPATIQLLQDFGINCGDIITINGDTFYVMSKELSASGCKLECFGNQYREKQPKSINSDIVALRGKTNELIRDLEKTQSTITDTANQLQSQITQTANSIRSEVSDTKNQLQSSIEQTASNITSTVSDNKKELESKIQQTADSITSTVSKQGQTITEIRQDLDGISLTYNSEEGTASITIGNITISELVDGKYVDRVVAGIDFSGYCRFSDLSTPGQTIICGDNITTGTISADRINLTGSISWGDLSSSCQNTIASYAGADGSDAQVPSYIHNTYIDATTIKSPTIYGAKIYAGTSAEGYIKLASTGMNFYSNSGGSVCGIGYYPGKYNLPYIMLGQGVDDAGTDKGMIKKYTNGIWIGDSDNASSDSPGGTGIFINFTSGTIQKYINGSVSTL